MMVVVPSYAGRLRYFTALFLVIVVVEYEGSYISSDDNDNNDGVFENKYHEGLLTGEGLHLSKT